MKAIIAVPQERECKGCIFQALWGCTLDDNFNDTVDFFQCFTNKTIYKIIELDNKEK